MNSECLITEKFASLKAVQCVSEPSHQEEGNIVLRDNISRRMQTDWIEKVVSWVVFFILCMGILLLLSSCAGVYAPPCQHVPIGDGKYGVTNTPCSRTIQYTRDSPTVKAICVETKNQTVHCQEAR